MVVGTLSGEAYLRQRYDRPWYELYDGEVIVVPAPFARHQRVGSHIEDILQEYERATGGIVLRSPTDIVLTEYDVIQPDIVFFRDERRQPIDMMAAIRLAPDLAVEISVKTVLDTHCLQALP